MGAMRFRAHVFVSGMVQGVSFRWYATQEARARGVGGWVRNLDDGRVEAVFEGAEEAVKALVEWCERGPRHARVSGVEVAFEEPEGLNEFDVEF
jgi:acylphosphatase